MHLELLFSFHMEKMVWIIVRLRTTSDLLRNTYESIEKTHRFFDDEDYNSFLNASERLRK